MKKYITLYRHPLNLLTSLPDIPGAHYECSSHTDGPWEPPCQSRNASRWLHPAVRGCGWSEWWSVRLRPSLTTSFSQEGPLEFPQHHPEALSLQPGWGRSRWSCYSYQALTWLYKKQGSVTGVGGQSDLHQLITADWLINCIYTKGFLAGYFHM